jgi:uncharacterized protein (DUF427 family)
MTESVWDYPRPPRVEHDARRVRVVLGGGVIAETTRALRVLETSHPPVFYIPAEDVVPGALSDPHGPQTFCEFKGAAAYHDVIGTDGASVPRAAWSYASPSRGFEDLRGAVAFYPALMDECTVDGEVVQAQAGDFYGGWITSEIESPFKGGPGTHGW